MNKETNNKALDTYLSLCSEVYDLSKSEPPEDSYAFYREYAIKVNGSILEPMCGTGRFLLPLLEDGFNVAGFDASEHMLQALHAKAKAKNLKPTVWKGFVEDLNRPEKYNLIFIPSGSFCLIIDPLRAEKALKAIYDHLNDDGIFLFELETLSSIPQQGIWLSSIWSKPNGQKIILSQLAEFQGDVCTSLCRYELMEAGKIIQTEIEELRVKIYKEDQLMELLQSAGFKHIRTLKAFDLSMSPSNQDESIVYECRK
jgi:SAM-dependent methyltransferase